MSLNRFPFDINPFPYPFEDKDAEVDIKGEHILYVPGPGVSCCPLKFIFTNLSLLDTKAIFGNSIVVE